MHYSKNHTVYTNDDGVEVPSATTVLKLLNKPSLVGWANHMGFKHIKVKDVLRESSEYGTVIHEILNHIMEDKTFELDDRFDRARIFRIVNNFFKWKKSVKKIKPILLEESFTSEKFGGTIDFYGEIKKKKTVLDYKTSKSIYLNMFFQLALYTVLLEENGYKVDQVGILDINEKGFTTKFIQREDLDPYIEFSLKLVDIFHLYCEININDKWKDLNQLLNL